MVLMLKKCFASLLIVLSICQLQNVLAESNKTEAIQLPDCKQDSFDVKFLPNSKILYLKINQDCEQLIKKLGAEFRKTEYNTDDVKGYVFDLQQSKLSNRVGSISGVASIFLPPRTSLGGMLIEGKVYSFETGQKYYQPAEIKEDYLHDLSQTFKTKPLILLTGEATDNISDGLVLIIARITERSIVLFGSDIIGGFWVNNTEINNELIKELSQHFPVNTSIVSYSNKPNKAYLWYLDSLGSCSNKELIDWKISARDIVRRNVHYPKEAERKGIEGIGTILINFLATGEIVESKVKYTTGNEYLDGAMLDAAKGVSIKPLSCLKQEANTVVGVPFVFKLLDQTEEPK